LLVADFDFHLPPELIAQEPASRGESRLMTLDRRSGKVGHAAISDLPALLKPGDLLVVNDTRVFAARLLGHRVPSGGAVECLLLGPPTEAEHDASEQSWNRTPKSDSLEPGPPQAGAVYDALVHPGQKLKPGAFVKFEGDAGVLMGEILAQRFYGRRRVRLWVESGGTLDELIDRLGHVPLPPYIRRPDSASDRERYQTVFARVRGSVAAPTAGLHFTPELLDRLEARGVERTSITLRVGYGTFKPVRADRVEDHVVDAERYEIGGAAAAAIAHARSEGRRVIAVGTTTTRALEDASIRGAGVLHPGTAAATIFIHPGFTFRVIDGLLTNFHLPRSSLLMLVSAFAGRERVLAAYAEAVRARYRFYSYGDAMLIM